MANQCKNSCMCQGSHRLEPVTTKLHGNNSYLLRQGSAASWNNTTKVNNRSLIFALTIQNEDAFAYESKRKQNYLQECLQNP